MSEQSKLSESFWTERYLNNETGWNIGYASTPIAQYIDQLENRSMRILIPGAGNGYEAEYLHEKGFKNVYVLDISKTPLENLAARFPEFPKSNLIHTNFFDHHKSDPNSRYDLILEQTFFCALDPSLRQKYADHMFQLLKEGGQLAGLWFSFPLVEGQENPPFGGAIDEYNTYFDQFDILTFENCYNSIEPRAGKEFFAILQKPIT